MSDLIDAVHLALAPHADPVRAAGQQRYMKSTMPYLGVTTATLRAALRPVLADPALAPQDRQEWEDTIRDLWFSARYREQRYAALALARARRYARWLDPHSMSLWERLIRDGAWWDVVDEIATHLVRDTVLHHPQEEGLRMREWAIDEGPNGMWVRRSAIICQVGAKARVDQALLTDAIEPNVGDDTPFGREFFIRKAIGWALRDHARVAPDWVRGFVAEHPDLSGLSCREALKHL